jgi:hypothetical protein
MALPAGRAISHPFNAAPVRVKAVVAAYQHGLV